MTEIESLISHIKELDKELEDIYQKLGFFRQNKSYYAKEQDRREKQASKE